MRTFCCARPKWEMKIILSSTPNAFGAKRTHRTHLPSPRLWQTGRAKSMDSSMWSLCSLWLKKLKKQSAVSQTDPVRVRRSLTPPGIMQTSKHEAFPKKPAFVRSRWGALGKTTGVKARFDCARRFIRADGSESSISYRFHFSLGIWREACVSCGHANGDLSRQF